jgi:hypothetical protein
MTERAGVENSELALRCGQLDTVIKRLVRVRLR